jgi:hypothetical protein
MHSLTMQHPKKTQKGQFSGGLSNVDMALARIAQAKYDHLGWAITF